MSSQPKKHRRRPPAPPEGVAVRRLALDALVRIDEQGAYANLVTGSVLNGSTLADRDRRFVTELVYGTTRMRRACDHLVERHRKGDVTPRVRAALRLGAYQLAFADVAAHAAVDTTVSATPKPARGLVNAVLRRVAGDVASGVEWPDVATRLSYPQWILDELSARLGADVAEQVLADMNLPAVTHTRADGYVQDPASQRVVEVVEAGPDHRVFDACAAPGGKATALAALGATVIAADRSANRIGLIVDNVARTSPTGTVAVLAADVVAPALRSGTFDRVLVDAPCSGLGVLRRRPDARWRIDAEAPVRLGALQRAALEAAAPLVAPGGRLVYSVCTLTDAENDGVVRAVDLAGFHRLAEETIVPDAVHDGMYLCSWERA